MKSIDSAILLRLCALLLCLLGSTVVCRGEPGQAAEGSGGGGAGDFFSLGAEARYWRASLLGTIDITKGGKPGTSSRINVQNDLDLDPSDSFVGAVSFSLGDFRLKVEYFGIDCEGSNRLDETIVFHAQTYPAGDLVKSRITLDYVTLGADYRFLNGQYGTLRAGIEGIYWAFDSELKSFGPATMLSENRGFSSVLPAVFIEGEARYGPLFVGSMVAAGTLGNERNLFEFDAMAGLRFAFFRIGGGWRYLHVDIKETTNEADLSAQGPFALMSAEFTW